VLVVLHSCLLDIVELRQLSHFLEFTGGQKILVPQRARYNKLVLRLQIQGFEFPSCIKNRHRIRDLPRLVYVRPLRLECTTANLGQPLSPLLLLIPNTYAFPTTTAVS